MSCPPRRVRPQLIYAELSAGTAGVAKHLTAVEGTGQLQDQQGGDDVDAHGVQGWPENWLLPFTFRIREAS